MPNHRRAMRALDLSVEQEIQVNDAYRPYIITPHKSTLKPAYAGFRSSALSERLSV